MSLTRPINHVLIFGSIYVENTFGTNLKKVSKEVNNITFIANEHSNLYPKLQHNSKYFGLNS